MHQGVPTTEEQRLCFSRKLLFAAVNCWIFAFSCPASSAIPAVNEFFLTSNLLWLSLLPLHITCFMHLDAAHHAAQAYPEFPCIDCCIPFSAGSGHQRIGRLYSAADNVAQNLSTPINCFSSLTSRYYSYFMTYCKDVFAEIG